MNLGYSNISIYVLYAILFVLFIRLFLTVEDRYAYANALSITENQLKVELYNRVSYLKSQAIHLNPSQNRKNLNVTFCETLPCVDSLEHQYQRKLEGTTFGKDQKWQYLYSEEFKQWNKLKYLMRLEYLVELYGNIVMGHTDMIPPLNGIIYGVSPKPFLGTLDQNPVLSNNLISINNGPFLRDTSQWFSVSYSDTLRLTYFKDNYSYGMGGDSIIKEYVYDISELKADRDL